MRTYLNMKCLPILLMCFGIIICENIHLSLDNLLGEKLIDSTLTGPVDVVSRGNGKVLRFDGNRGPVSMKYTLEKATDSISSCFQSLSHCKNYYIKFWVKLSLNSTYVNEGSFIHHGPRNNHQKGLNIGVVNDNTLKITYDDGNEQNLLLLPIIPHDWNMIKIISNSDGFNAEANGIIIPATSQRSTLNSSDISIESLVLGFKEKSKGIIVYLDDFKFEQVPIFNQYQSNYIQNEESSFSSRSLSQEKQMTYSGQNYLKYNFENKILRPSQNEQLDLTFRFHEDINSGLIWYAEKGLEKSFIYLKDSRLYYVYIYRKSEGGSVITATEEIYVPQVLASNKDHRLIITRTSDRLTLTINENLKANKAIIVGRVPLLPANGQIYIGGHNEPKIVTEGKIDNRFKGTIKNVVVTGNEHETLDFIEISKDSKWKSIVSDFGEVRISYGKEQDQSHTGEYLISALPVPFTFTEFDKLVRFSPWDFEQYESIEMQFKTKEPRGVLLFVGPDTAHTDYVCLEFFDKNLYLAFGIDASDYRIQMNPIGTEATTGNFHTIFIKRDRNHKFTAKYDHVDVPIGAQSGHQRAFGTYTYIGGIDNPTRLPWFVWSREGFVGCINYMRVNEDKYIDPRGKNNQYSGDIAGVDIGKCFNDVRNCKADLCEGGVCHDRSFPYLSDKNFFCDCSQIPRTYRNPVGNIERGEICVRESEVLTSDGSSFYVVDFKAEESRDKMMKTHTDDIVISFKTKQSDTTIFKTYRSQSDLYFSVLLDGGFLVVDTNINDKDSAGKNQRFRVPVGGLNDNQWHTVHIKRRAERIMIYVDNVNNQIEGKIPVFNYGRTFDNTFEYILVGSQNLETGKEKYIGSIRNFYWNQFDFLGTPRLAGTYRGTIKTPKPSLPPLPPYPRDPPVKCTMKSDHRYTKVSNIPASEEEIGFYIEFKTRYNGVIWHGYDVLGPNDRYITLMIIDNQLLLIYRINEDNNLYIIEEGSQFQSSDNIWHRVVILLNKKLRRITAHADKGYQPKIINLAVSKSIDMSKMDFYFGGMPDVMYSQVFTQLRITLPRLAERVALYKEWSLVGCLGEFLVSEDKYRSNRLSGASGTYPLNTLDCSGCREPMKCQVNFCQNGGVCYQTAIDKLACNCSATSFIGEKCDKLEPRCPQGFCLNRGRCFMFGNQPRCDCSGTGYRGDRCEQSHCSDSFCFNNGLCKIINGSPTCDCRGSQHYGKLCEKPICSDLNCNNRGRCSVVNNQPICDCTATGYIGSNCEQEICPINFCKNNGRCIPRNNKPACECTSEYTGFQCEERVCSNDFCYNGGQCYAVNNIPTCRCSDNFEGSKCQIPKVCPSSYCLYGGTCQIINGNPFCDCQNTDYEGDRCNIPKTCPRGYCQNGGNCLVNNGRYSCECLVGFRGPQCQHRTECPPNFCQNNGLCSVVNNNFKCDCTRTGHSGDNCANNVIGILNENDKYGYVVYPLNPPVKSTEDSINVGFQTYNRGGTLYTFKTQDGKFWSLRMENGKLVVDVNGRIYRMQKVINDGQYHVVNIEKKGNYILVNLMGPQQESVTLPFNEIISGQSNEIWYNTVIIGANNRESDIFKGAIGGFNWNGKYYIDQIQTGEGERKGVVSIIIMPSIITKPVSCPNNYCHNSGICILIDTLPYCQCEHTGYFGLRCSEKTYGIFPKDRSYGGYLIYNINPPMPTHKDEMKFLMQTRNFPDNPIVRFELEGNRYYEIIMIQGQLFLRDDRNMLKLISDGQRLDSGNPYLVRFERDRENIVFYINGRRTTSFNLSNLTGTGGSLIHKRIVLGADTTFKKYFQGALGGFEWNGVKLIDESGKIKSQVDEKGNIRIILMPTKNLTIIHPPVVKKPLPDLVPTGNHGGVVWTGTGIFVPGTGIGGGLLVPSGVGPIVLGAGSYLAVVVSPLLGGLFLAGLLLLSALLWACWRCKPGCCPCCAGLAHGKSSAAALKQKILTPVQISAFSTGGGKTGEKGFWSKMKSTLGTPITHNMYQTGGHKMENVALLSSNANGIAHGDQGDFHSTAVRVERLNVNRNMGGSMQSLPGGPLLYTGTNNIRTTRSVTGGASYGHNYGHGNMLDVTDRFGTIGQGSIMRIDTTHHETDFDGRPNVFAGEEMKVDCCVLSQNSRYAVTGSANSPPQIWDMQSGELYKVMDGMEIGCTDLHLACGDKVLVGLVMDEMPSEASEHHRLKRLQMWDFMTGAQIAMPLDVMCSSSCITNSSDHMIINREFQDGGMSVICWDLQANHPVKEIHYQPQDIMNHEGITFLKISHNDRMVVAGFTGIDDQAHYMVFDLMASYPNGVVVQPLLASFNGKVTATEIIGADEAITGTKKGELIIWNLRTAKPVRQILIHATLEGNTQTKLNPHKDAINCIAISKNGEYLVSGSADQTVNVYTMADERLMHSLEGHADDVLSAVISLDNEIIVSGSWDGSMRVWNLESGSQMCWFTSNIEILSVKLTNDKKAIVALGERMGLRKLIMLQIIRNRTRRTRHTGGTVGSPPFSPMPI